MAIVTDPELLSQLNDTQQSVSPQTQDELNRREAAKMAWGDYSPGQQFALGLAKPFVETYAGVRDIFGEVPQETRENLQRLEEAQSPMATLGSITGDVAALAVPLPLPQKLSMFPKMAQRLARLAAETVKVGGYEGLKIPEADETRLGNAGTGAGYTAGLGTLGIATGQALSAGGRYLRSDGAGKLLEEGVELTPGMIGVKPLATLESKMADLPLIGTPVRRMQDNAVTQWNQKILNDVAPAGSKITAAGEDGFQQLQNAFSESYTNLWGRLSKDSFTKKAARDVYQELQNSHSKTRYLSGDAAPQAKALIDNAMQAVAAFRRTGDPRILERADDLLRSTPSVDVMTREILNEARKSLRGGFSDDFTSTLSSLDEQYAKFSTATRAGSYVRSLENDSIFDPRLLTAAVKARGTERATTAGNALLQPQMKQAAETIAPALVNRSATDSARPLAPYLLGAATVAAPKVVIPAAIGARAMVTEGMRNILTGGQPSTRFSHLSAALRNMVAVEDRREKEKLELSEDYGY